MVCQQAQGIGIDHHRQSIPAGNRLVQLRPRIESYAWSYAYGLPGGLTSSSRCIREHGLGSLHMQNGLRNRELQQDAVTLGRTYGEFAHTGTHA